MRNCDLCNHPGGELLWSDDQCRVILVEGAEATAYPGFCRVIWNQHVAEMSDLNEVARSHLMRVVYATESVLRTVLTPHKINLASLGNVVPHLHWHVIPRWQDDPCFPRPIWGGALRPVPARAQPDPDALRAALATALAS